MTRFMLCVLAVLCAPLAFAQSLTPAQMAGVRSAACADTNTARPMMLAGDANALIGWLNADSTFVVWRTRLTRDEATGDGFDWAQADNLTTGQARIWEWLFDNDRRATNPSSASVRAGISEAWKGTAAKLAVATFVLAASKRPANNIERALATGTGTTATPGLLTFEGRAATATPIVYRDDCSLWGCP